MAFLLVFSSSSQVLMVLLQRVAWGPPAQCVLQVIGAAARDGSQLSAAPYATAVQGLIGCQVNRLFSTAQHDRSPPSLPGTVVPAEKRHSKGPHTLSHTLSTQAAALSTAASPAVAAVPDNAATSSGARPTRTRRKLDINSIPMLGAFQPQASPGSACGGSAPATEAKAGPVDASHKEATLDWREMLRRARELNAQEEAALAARGAAMLTDTFRCASIQAPLRMPALPTRGTAADQRSDRLTHVDTQRTLYASRKLPDEPSQVCVLGTLSQARAHVPPHLADRALQPKVSVLYASRGDKPNSQQPTAIYTGDHETGTCYAMRQYTRYWQYTCVRCSLGFQPKTLYCTVSVLCVYLVHVCVCVLGSVVR